MAKKQHEQSDKIFTIPNVISFIRLLLIPVFIIVLCAGHNFYAFLIFLLASLSDGIDGAVARATNSCSKLGKILDPIADRLMIIAIAITLCALKRLELWVLVLILLRDFLMLFGGYFCMKRFDLKINVIMLGKIATACMYVGLASLILLWPMALSGLGWITVSWLPGFGSDPYFCGIWFVYTSIILNIFSTGYYIRSAFIAMQESTRKKVGRRV